MHKAAAACLMRRAPLLRLLRARGCKLIIFSREACVCRSYRCTVHAAAPRWLYGGVHRALATVTTWRRHAVEYSICTACHVQRQ